MPRPPPLLSIPFYQNLPGLNMRLGALSTVYVTHTIAETHSYTFTQGGSLRECWPFVANISAVMSHCTTLGKYHLALTFQ